MRQHDYCGVTGLLSLCCQERAAERRVHPQHLKEVATDILHPDGLSGGTGGRQQLSLDRVRGQARENLVLVSVGQILGIRQAMGLLRVLVTLRDHDELVWVRRRKRAEEERAGDAEHRFGVSMTA